MKNLLILVLLANLISCTKEKIIVENGPRTASEQQAQKSEALLKNEGEVDQKRLNVTTLDTKEKIDQNKNDKVYFIRGTYHLDTIEVNKPVNGGPKLIQGIGNLIAGIIVRIGGNFDIEMDPIPMDVSDIDPEIVKVATIKNIKLEVLDKNAKLDFIKKLRLNLRNHKDEKSVQLLEKKYSKKEAEQTECGLYCLNIPVHQINLIDHIQDTKEILLQPEVEIGKTPKDKFELKISIEFEIGLTMPL